MSGQLLIDGKRVPSEQTYNTELKHLQEKNFSSSGIAHVKYGIDLLSTKRTDADTLYEEYGKTIPCDDTLEWEALVCDQRLRKPNYTIDHNKQLCFRDRPVRGWDEYCNYHQAIVDVVRSLPANPSKEMVMAEVQLNHSSIPEFAVTLFCNLCNSNVGGGGGAIAIEQEGTHHEAIVPHMQRDDNLAQPLNVFNSHYARTNTNIGNQTITNIGTQTNNNINNNIGNQTTYNFNTTNVTNDNTELLVSEMKELKSQMKELDSQMKEVNSQMKEAKEEQRALIRMLEKILR